MSKKKETKLNFIALLIKKVPYKGTELIELEFKPSLLFSDESNPNKTSYKEVNNFYCVLIDFNAHVEVSVKKQAGYLDKRFALVAVYNNELPDFTKIYRLSNTINVSSLDEELNNFISSIGYKLIDKEEEDKIKKIKSKLTDEELHILGLDP